MSPLLWFVVSFVSAATISTVAQVVSRRRTLARCPKPAATNSRRSTGDGKGSRSTMNDW
jgi:hypothetical protein